MNREILFRGKRKDNNKWVYGLYAEIMVRTEPLDGFNGLCFLSADAIFDRESGMFGNKYEVITDTIGQYTGLTDANGKKIFEGDILREYSNEIEDWVVSYEYGKFIGTSDNVCEDLYELLI